MKKILPALVLISLLAVPVIGLAQYQGEEPPDDGAPTIITSGAGLMALIENIGDWIFMILLALAAIFLILAGFFFITAGGNPEAVNKARGMLMNALIGVAVALGAKGLVAVITSILAG